MSQLQEKYCSTRDNDEVHNFPSRRDKVLEPEVQSQVECLVFRLNKNLSIVFRYVDILSNSSRMI